MHEDDTNKKTTFVANQLISELLSDKVLFHQYIFCLKQVFSKREVQKLMYNSPYCSYVIENILYG